MEVRGALAPATLQLQNARAVVVLDNSKAYASNLTARGRFAMTIPGGHAFRVYIANNESPTVQRVVGKVVVPNHSWLKARGSVVNFGTLKLAGTASSPAAGVKADLTPDEAGPDQAEPGVTTDTDSFCGTHVTEVDTAGADTPDTVGVDPDQSAPATSTDKDELSAKGPCAKPADAGGL